MNRPSSRIPKEIDELIWKLTEDGTPAAFDQFRARYPEHAKTLASRLQMVDRLKGSRPAAEITQVPKFRPAAVQNVPRPFWSPLAVGMVSVAVVALIATVYIYLPRPPAPKPIINRETPSVAQGFVPNVGENTKKPENVQPAPVPEATPVTPSGQDGGRRTDEIPAYLTPQTLAIRNAKLSLVVQAVAQQGKFAINIGPGLADPVISVDYRGVNSIEILQDLGRQYAFTPFDQGDGTVIIVPARDPNAGPSDKSVDSTPSTPTPQG
jgi:hypothetical protein